MNCKLGRLVRRFWPLALYLCAVGGWIALCCHDASYGMFWPALAVASLPAALFSAPNYVNMPTPERYNNGSGREKQNGKDHA